MLRLLRRAYATTGVNEFARTVTTELPHVIPSEVTSYNEIDPVRGRSLNWVEPVSVATDAQNSAWEQHMGAHPVLRHYLETRDGRALRITDFVSQRQFEATGLYREHYVPLQTDQVLAIFLDVDAPRAVGLGLHRKGPAFTDRERLILELLRPHLLQAHRNALAFRALRDRVDLLVGQLGAHLVGLDRHGRIRFTTRDAMARLEAYLGADRRPGRLPAPLEAWRARQAHRLGNEHEGALHDAPPLVEPFVIDCPGKRLVVRYLLDGDGSLLLVEERSLGPRADHLLARGLTAREAEVVCTIAQGNTNATTAQLLGMSPRTVEKHLEHAYAKLGVANRTAAVAIAHG